MQLLLASCLLCLCGCAISAQSTIQVAGGQGSNITYESYYSDASQRPNVCTVTFRSKYRRNVTGQSYVPVLGTSLVNDNALLLLRLLHSLDFPVKHVVVVVAARKRRGQPLLEAGLVHAKRYVPNLSVLECEQRPSVSEGWNAVFSAFPAEPWGVYAARDAAFTPGALKLLATHVWRDTERGELDFGLINWVNVGPGLWNVIVLTRAAINRAGMFDETIYPAFCEDVDYAIRMRKLSPPLREKCYDDVFAIHGAEYNRGYHTGMLADPHSSKDPQARKLLGRHPLNCHYVRRKWGCPGEVRQGLKRRDPVWFKNCTFTHPFNRSELPLWYWHTSKRQRVRDLQLGWSQKPGSVGPVHRTSGQLLFKIPEHYGSWAGYDGGEAGCALTGEGGRQGGTGRCI